MRRPREGLVSPSPGVLRVTVRWHYDWLPFSGLDATARAGRNPRARGSEEEVRPSSGSYGPGATSPAVERREARWRASFAGDPVR